MRKQSRNVGGRCRVAAVAMLALAACDRGALPTAPEPAPTTAPPGYNLAGTWSMGSQASGWTGPLTLCDQQWGEPPQDRASSLVLHQAGSWVTEDCPLIDVHPCYVGVLEGAHLSLGKQPRAGDWSCGGLRFQMLDTMEATVENEHSIRGTRRVTYTFYGDFDGTRSLTQESAWNVTLTR
jgi:hypothetical protein